MKKILIYLFVTSLVLAGCQNSDEPVVDPSKPVVELSITALSFVNDFSGEQAITINATTDWTAKCSQSWCKLSALAGQAGRTRLVVSVEPHSGIVKREATITISAKNVEPKTITIVQLGQNEEIILFEPSPKLTGEAQNLDVHVATNVESLSVNISGQTPWIKMAAVAPIGGNSQADKIISFTIDANSTKATRVGSVVFKGGNATPATLTITQEAQKQVELKITSANVDEAIGMWATGMEIKFEVNTTVNYTMTMEGGFMQELSRNNNSYIIQMDANTGAARSGRIIVAQEGTELADTLNVHQLGVGEQFVGSHYLDSIALRSIYNAIDMKNWGAVNGVSWAFDFEKPMTEWRQIKLDANGRVNSWQVLGMQKADTNFRFAIPADIRELTQLKYLTLNSWNLSNIPAEIGQLSQLDSVSMVGNFIGTIPASLGNLSNLRYLSISGNVQKDPSSSQTVLRVCGLSGGIPAQIYTLTNLEVLRINYTKVGGTIPSSIANLTKLMGLYFESNELTGSIPTSMGQLSNLEGLILRLNKLSGSIPDELGDLSKLSVLVLNGNQLTGSIPATLCNLSDLEFLYLYDNQLTGEIPANIGNLKKLYDLILYSNELTGSIPASIGDLENLESLYIYNNQLTGPIPSELGNLRHLIQIVAFTNQLSGAIPASLDNIPTLEVLVVPANNLSGTVPSGILSKVKNDPNNFIICPQNAGYSYSNHTCSN